MFVNINGIDVEILNFSESNYNTVESALKSSLSLPKAKNRDVIYQAFKLAVSLAPQANASDLSCRLSDLHGAIEGYKTIQRSRSELETSKWRCL